MKPLLAITVVIVLAVGASAAAITDPTCKGFLHGVAISEDSQPVAGIQLVLYPIGVDLAYVLPTVRTNQLGEYRFEHVCTARFTVLVDDERAGYPPYSLVKWMSKNPEVKLTRKHLDAELSVHIPPKGALLDVIAQNSQTKAVVPEVEVMIMTSQVKMYEWIKLPYESSRSLLLPANMELRYRVIAQGYREWQGGKKKGKQIQLAPESRTTLKVELEPLAGR